MTWDGRCEGLEGLEGDRCTEARGVVWNGDGHGHGHGHGWDGCTEASGERGAIG